MCIKILRHTSSHAVKAFIEKQLRASSYAASISSERPSNFSPVLVPGIILPSDHIDPFIQDGHLKNL